MQRSKSWMNPGDEKNTHKWKENRYRVNGASIYANANNNQNKNFEKWSMNIEQIVCNGVAEMKLSWVCWKPANNAAFLPLTLDGLCNIYKCWKICFRIWILKWCAPSIAIYRVRGWKRKIWPWQWRNEHLICWRLVVLCVVHLTKRLFYYASDEKFALIFHVSHFVALSLIPIQMIYVNIFFRVGLPAYSVGFTLEFLLPWIYIVFFLRSDSYFN